MKRKYSATRLLGHSTIWIGCAAACCSLSLQISATAGTPAPAAPAAAPELPTNSIGFIVGGAIVDGNDAAFQRRWNQNGDFYGGISNLNWSGDVSDGLTFDLEGHAVFGLEDYAFLATLTKEDLGYVQFGYKQFRTWYDGSGGYVPNVPGSWVPIYDDDLSVDRGEVWFEAGLRMDDLPEMTFRYTHAWRDGTKDSTSWGTAGSYKTVPALTLIDEYTDTFRLDVTHTLGNTDLAGGLSYQGIRNDDSRVMRNGATGTTPTAGTRVVDTNVYDADIFNGYLTSETRIGERLLLSFGYSYTNFDTDMGGDRPSTNNVDGFLRTGTDHALWGIAGGTQGSTNVLNANVWWNPTDCVTIVPSLRAEFWDNGGWANHLGGVAGRDGGGDIGSIAPADYSIANGYVRNGLAGVYPGSTDPYYGWLEEFRSYNSDQYEEFTEAVELRYTGVSDVLLYGKMEFTQLNGDLNRMINEDFHNGTGIHTSTRNTDTETDRQKYTLGANWYAAPGISLAAQAYYKLSDSSYDNLLVGEDAQMRQSNYETADANLRLTWRAMPNLTLVSRYDYQQTTYENQGLTGANADVVLPLIESADIESHIFSQSATWMPINRAYFQGMISYVMSTTDTPADGQAPTRITDFDNDYLVASLTAGYALDDRTDITASYSYYFSDNYTVPMNGAVAGSVGYGSGLEEHVFSVSLNREITPTMLWSLGYGFYTGNDASVNGFNDYNAHVISTGLQIRF